MYLKHHYFVHDVHTVFTYVPFSPERLSLKFEFTLYEYLSQLPETTHDFMKLLSAAYIHCFTITQK